MGKTRLEINALEVESFATVPSRVGGGGVEPTEIAHCNPATGPTACTCLINC